MVNHIVKSLGAVDDSAEVSGAEDLIMKNYQPKLLVLVKGNTSLMMWFTDYFCLQL